MDQRIKKTFAALWSFLMLTPSSFGGRDSSPEARRESFEIVWRTVNEKHFDPTFGGVDWEQVRRTYEPRVAQLKSDAELYELLQRMLGELHQSHFGIIPPGAGADDVAGQDDGGVGIDIRIVSGAALISRVEPGSSAERAGIHPGFTLTRVGETEVKRAIQRAAHSSGSAQIGRLRQTRAILHRLSGPPGSSVRIEYLDGVNRRRVTVLTRERLNGEVAPAFGYFPRTYTEFESRRLSGGIGYIRFNVFVAPLMDRIRDVIRSMADAPGVVFDLRGNPGGIGGMSSGITGLLDDKQIVLGTMSMRSGQLRFISFPQKDPYLGPLVVLIDGLSASTSEIFAGGLQESGRATIVGERSAGAALPSIITKLPTGALFQYAIADFKTPKGTLIEGRGVIPNVEVGLSRAALLGGRDPQLETAVRVIRSQAVRRHKRAA
jgi:carboxyl-terminal processing protease